MFTLSVYIFSVLPIEKELPEEYKKRHYNTGNQILFKKKIHET